MTVELGEVDVLGDVLADALGEELLELPGQMSGTGIGSGHDVSVDDGVGLVLAATTDGACRADDALGDEPAGAACAATISTPAVPSATAATASAAMPIRSRVVELGVRM